MQAIDPTVTCLKDPSPGYETAFEEAWAGLGVRHELEADASVILMRVLTLWFFGSIGSSKHKEYSSTGNGNL